MSAKRTRFEKEVLLHVPSLYRLAVHYTHDEAEAEDLVQDTLIKAYKHLDSYEAGTHCRAWLMRILTNTFINRYHHKSLEHAFIESTQKKYIEMQGSFLDGGDGSLMTEEVDYSSEKYYMYYFSDETIHAFKSLPRDFSSIIVLADLMELSYREISEKLEIPMGTVMSRLSRARHTMKAVLGSYAHSLGYN